MLYYFLSVFVEFTARIFLPTACIYYLFDKLNTNRWLNASLSFILILIFNVVWDFALYGFDQMFFNLYFELPLLVIWTIRYVRIKTQLHSESAVDFFTQFYFLIQTLYEHLTSVITTLLEAFTQSYKKAP